MGNCCQKFVLEMLDLIAKHKLVLSTGHSSPEEILMLIREAKERGVENILVTNPLYWAVMMSVEQMKEAARMGAYIEFIYSLFTKIVFGYVRTHV